MSAMTSYLQKALQDHTLGIASFTMPTVVYLSLHTASPGKAGSLANEVSLASIGYARISLAGKMNPTDSVSGVSTNNATLLFGPATADWGSVQYVAISDASTGGNMLLFASLSQVQTTPIGESVQFSTGQFIGTFF